MKYNSTGTVKENIKFESENENENNEIISIFIIFIIFMIVVVICVHFYVNVGPVITNANTGINMINSTPGFTSASNYREQKYYNSNKY